MVPILEGEFVDIVRCDLADAAPGHVERPEITHWCFENEKSK